MLYKNTSYQINAIIEYDNEFNFHFVCFTALTIYGIGLRKTTMATVYFYSKIGNTVFVELKDLAALRLTTMFSSPTLHSCQV